MVIAATQFGRGTAPTCFRVVDTSLPAGIPLRRWLLISWMLAVREQFATLHWGQEARPERLPGAVDARRSAATSKRGIILEPVSRI